LFLRFLGSWRTSGDGGLRRLGSSAWVFGGVAIIRFMTSSRRWATSSCGGGFAMADDPKSVSSLKAYYKAKAVDINDTLHFTNSVRGETDRAMIVIWASVLEDAIDQRLRTKVKPWGDSPPDEQSFARLFGVGGPLGSFSSKIDMSCALGLIDQATREMLHLIREMRNACAHSQRPISLQTPSFGQFARGF
jgi:hypothetical protein